jgi:hypothetical protein
VVVAASYSDEALDGNRSTRVDVGQSSVQNQLGAVIDEFFGVGVSRGPHRVRMQLLQSGQHGITVGVRFAASTLYFRRDLGSLST